VAPPADQAELGVINLKRVSGLALILASVALAEAQNTPPPIAPPTPPPIQTGVVPLPTGFPSTAQQFPNPTAIKPLPSGAHPLAWSPKLGDVDGFLAKAPITIDQAVAVSLYTSRDFATAVAALVQASARTGEARSALFPTIGVNENLTYYDKATTVNFAAFSGGSTTATTTSPPLVVLPQFNPIFTASLSLPLDLFGTLRSAVSQAQFNEVAARVDVNRVRNQTIFNVKNAFYGVLRASAQVAVAEDSVNNTLERLNFANKNYAAGTTSRFDILTAQRDVADAQQNLISAKGQVALNLATLKNTMGLDISSRLSIKNDGAVEFPNGVDPMAPNSSAMIKPGLGNVVTQNPESPQTVPNIVGVMPPESGRNSAALDPTKSNVVKDDFDFGPDFPDLLAEAMKDRPEILEAEAKVTAGRKGLQYAIRSTLPSFNFSLEDIYTANATPLERQNQEAVVLGINVPIFDGGLARAMAKQQRGLIAQAEIERRQALDQVQVDVQQALVSLVQSRQRVAVSQVELAEARESFRVSRVRYLAGVSGTTGVSPQLEISNAQTSLAQAESNVVNAIYDYNTARAQLDRATGRYSFVENGPGYKSPPKIAH
jgi:outer membrane protein